MYRSIPQADYKLMSGRQNKTLHEQAARYGLPFNRASIDLTELLPALHQFLADNAAVLGKDPEGILGGPETDNLDRLRLAQAIKVEMQNDVEAGVLRPVADVHKVSSEISHLLRDAADSIFSELDDTDGDVARGILIDAIERGKELLDSAMPQPPSGDDE